MNHVHTLRDASHRVDKQAYTCSIIMGYPMVVKNTRPAKTTPYPLTPVFHWFPEKDRKRQFEYAINS